MYDSMLSKHTFNITYTPHVFSLKLPFLDLIWRCGKTLVSPVAKSGLEHVIVAFKSFMSASLRDMAKKQALLYLPAFIQHIIGKRNYGLIYIEKPTQYKKKQKGYNVTMLK